MSSRIVALLTDFGQRDPFVGTMKGVMLGINPDLQLIDLSHEITPQRIREAAIVLAVVAPISLPTPSFSSSSTLESGGRGDRWSSKPQRISSLPLIMVFWDRLWIRQRFAA